MASNPDDVANNPYNEGGARSAAAPQPSVWFCHSCQRDFPGNQLLHTPDPACPHCHGDFVEETGESIDDPHEFDRPVFPFAPLMGQPPGQGHPNDQQERPRFMFVPAPGQAAGPFGMLFQALAQGMQQGHPPQQQQHPAARPASAPPLSPEEAARQAAQRRAGLSPEPSGSTAGQTLPPEAANRQDNAQHQDANSASRPSSASGVYRTGPATFVWTSGGSRPPPASYPSSPQPQHAHIGESRPQPVPQQQPENQGHVRNLASFLQEAFSGGHRSTSGTNDQQQQQQSSSDEQGNPQPTPQGDHTAGQGQTAGHQSDPLAHMLGGLANMFGFPIQGLTAAQQQQRRESGQQQEQQRGGAPAGPGENTTGSRTHHFSFGAPGQGGHIVFTIGGPPGDTAANPMPAFLPFMMGLGHETHAPGQMGDYVFSQGALDNIITELMNQAQGRYGPQPATEEIINNLPTFKMTQELLSSDTINECAVCKDDFAEEEDVMKLPCNHIFHVDCIKPWLERSGTCPICRHQLVPQPEPPRAPGQEGTAGQADAQTPATNTEGDHNPVRQQSNPSSPSLPRSPPITGGSSMPGSFPFGNLFTTIGNMMGGQSDTGTGATGTAARSSGDTGSMASTEQRDGNNQQSGRQSEARQETQGQPDMDLDLD